MPWALILPMIFEIIQQCLEDRNRDEAQIIKGLRKPGMFERAICRHAVHEAYEEAGLLDGLSWKQKRKSLKQGRAKAMRRLSAYTKVELRVMVSGCAAQAEANR